MQATRALNYLLRIALDFLAVKKRMNRLRSKRRAAFQYESLEDRRLLTVYTPQQIMAAFGTNQVNYGPIKGDGTGQTIAILDPGDDPYLLDSTDPNFLTSDLHQFDAHYNLLDPPSFKVVGQGGGARPTSVIIDNIMKVGQTITVTTKTAHGLASGNNVNISANNNSDYDGTWNNITVIDPTHFSFTVASNSTEATGYGGFINNNVNTGETVGDIEWAHVIAPGAAIVLIEMNSYGFADVAAAVQTAVTVVGASIVSMSFDSPEFPGETSTGPSPAFENDAIFNVPGVAFINSSGDNAAPSEYPASSPNVLSVGGTSLNLNTDGSYKNENGWSNNSYGRD